MTSLAQDLCLRPEGPSDEAFLLRLFAGTRAAELAFLGPPGAAPGGWTPMQETFLRIQHLAQTRGYQAAYPNAERSIVLLGGEPAGRWMVDREGESIVLVDVAFLPEHRGKGLGTALLKRLLAEASGAASALGPSAAATGRKVKLHVALGNPAIRLYQRLGFVRTGGDELRDCMEWAP